MKDSDLITKTVEGKSTSHHNIKSITFYCDGRHVSISLDSLRDNFRKARTEGILTETKDPHPYQSERDTVLDETSNGVVLWSPAHIFRLICRLDETELEYLLSDIRWLQERNFKRNHPELRQAGES